MVELHLDSTDFNNVTALIVSTFYTVKAVQFECSLFYVFIIALLSYVLIFLFLLAIEPLLSNLETYYVEYKTKHKTKSLLIFTSLSIFFAFVLDYSYGEFFEVTWPYVLIAGIVMAIVFRVFSFTLLLITATIVYDRTD